MKGPERHLSALCLDITWLFIMIMKISHIVSLFYCSLRRWPRQPYRSGNFYAPKRTNFTEIYYGVSLFLLCALPYLYTRVLDTSDTALRQFDHAAIFTDCRTIPPLHHI